MFACIFHLRSGKEDSAQLPHEHSVESRYTVIGNIELVWTWIACTTELVSTRLRRVGIQTYNMKGNTLKLHNYLTLFASSGDKEAIVGAHALLTTTDTKFSAVENNVLQDVIRQAAKVLKGTSNNDMRIAAWCCLWALADNSRNAKNEEFLQCIQPALLLPRAVRGCVSTEPLEAEFCLKFLVAYTHRSDTRSDAVTANADLVKSLESRLGSTTVLSAMDLDPADYNILQYSLNVIKNVLDTCASPEGMLKYGLFEKVRAMFSTVCSFCFPAIITDKIPDLHKPKDSGSSKYLDLVCYCVQVLADLYKAIGRSFYTLARHMQHKYYTHDNGVDTIDDSLMDIAICLYFLFDYSDNDILRCYVRNCTMQYFSHVMITYHGTQRKGVDMARILSLCNPEDPAALTFGQKIVYFIRNHEVRLQEEAHGLALALDAAGTFFPAAQELVLQELGGHVECCAVRNCRRSSLQPRLLKQCVKCMSVWYCGREHQLAHWKEHKAECKQRTVAPAAEKAGADVVQES